MRKKKAPRELREVYDKCVKFRVYPNNRKVKMPTWSEVKAAYEEGRLWYRKYETDGEGHGFFEMLYGGGDQRIWYNNRKFH